MTLLNRQSGGGRGGAAGQDRRHPSSSSTPDNYQVTEYAWLESALELVFRSYLTLIIFTYRIFENVNTFVTLGS